VNIHGHTHDGVGFRRIEKLKIVNAGPLVWENYTILDLIKKEGKWEV
jgi:Icc-related predicted phosphoesterase